MWIFQGHVLLVKTEEDNDNSIKRNPRSMFLTAVEVTGTIDIVTKTRCLLTLVKST